MGGARTPAPCGPLLLPSPAPFAPGAEGCDGCCELAAGWATGAVVPYDLCGWGEGPPWGAEGGGGRCEIK